jgi:hypothetical protein
MEPEALLLHSQAPATCPYSLVFIYQLDAQFLYSVIYVLH